MESADQVNTQEVPVNPTPTSEVPEKDVFVWTAPSRPFKRRDRQFYVTVIAIAVIVGLVLFLAEGVMPVVLLTSLIFLFYILNTVEPEKIEYKITNKGVKIADKGVIWGDMGRFWFSRRFDNTLLIIETGFLPGRLELVVNEGDKEEIKKAFKDRLKEEEVPPSLLDKTANWFAKKLPGNN